VAKKFHRDGEKTCGDEGGLTHLGKPCSRVAGWGTAHKGWGKCRSHREVTTRFPQEVQRPKKWDLAVLAAYYYQVAGDLSENQFADLVGVTRKTLYRWRISPWWPEACEEAARRYHPEVKIESRRTLLGAIRTKGDGEPGDVQSARWALERLDPEFAPPKQQLEITTTYMHRNEVVALMTTLAAIAAELIDDPIRRQELARRARAEITPLLLPVGPAEEQEEGDHDLE